MGNKQSASAELGTHDSAVYGLCCSPDGKLVLSASGDKTVTVWDTQKLEAVRHWKGHGASVYCCAVSPDGGVALSGDMDGCVKVWRVADGEEIGTIEEHEQAVMSVAFSRDGCRALSASADKTIVHWDVTENEDGRVTGIKMHHLTGHRGAVRCAIFAPDGMTALSASSDKTLKVWNLKTGKEARTLVGHRDAVMACDLSPDGEFAVSASQDNTIKVWKVATGKEVRTLIGHTDAVRSCCFSHDGAMILSGSYDLKCIVWVRVAGTETWTRASVLQNHTRGVTSCAFTPDGMVAVSGSWDSSVVLSAIGDARLFADFEEEDSSLQQLLQDTKMAHPAMHAVVADVDAMSGCFKVKAMFGYLCTFWLRYGRILGLPNTHVNALLYGQQGTGKTHFARLLARLLQAAKIAPHGGAAAHNSDTPSSEGVGGGGGGAEPHTGGEASLDRPVPQDEQGIVILRATKIKGATAEQTGANLRAMLEKHKGQVVLVREAEMLPSASPSDHCGVLMRGIQQFLNDCPNTLTLMILGQSRADLGKILMFYNPATPDTVRNHFPFRFEFDKYDAEELLAIFRRQCTAEQLRFGGSVTDVMLDKTFRLNASFMEGTNASGTKKLLKVARLEQSKRQDRREGVLESTDMQSAFQKLRQDWFEMHPDQTFTVLQQIQSGEKARGMRKSMGLDDDAAEDAGMAALEAENDSERESEDDEDDAGFTLEDYRMFHDKEMKRREAEHREKMQRERDECKLVVEQTKRAHMQVVTRMRTAALSMAGVKWQLRCEVRTLQRWQAAAVAQWGMRKTMKVAVERRTRTAMMRLVREWHRLAGFSRTYGRRCQSHLAVTQSRVVEGCFGAWLEHCQTKRQERMRIASGTMRLLEVRDSLCVLEEVFEAWSTVTEEELVATERQWAEKRREKEHAEAMEALKEKHNADLTELHLDYQERVRSQKDLRRRAESSLAPMKKWRHNVTLAATILMVLYAAPTFPAVAPYVIQVLKQLSFNQWYIGIIIIFSLYKALKRFCSWLWASVLPEKVKASCRWLWDTGVDSALVSLLVTFFSWTYACSPPEVVREVVGPYACSVNGECKVQMSKGQGDLDGYTTCAIRVERVIKVVVFVAGFVFIQMVKVLGMQLHQQGLGSFIRAKVARMVPSWFYSLQDQNSAEMISMVQDDMVPPGKKAKACQRLAELAKASDGMVSVIVEGGGTKVLIDLLGTVSSQDVVDLATSGVKALKSLLTTTANIKSAVDKGAVHSLAKLLLRSASSRVIDEALTALCMIAASGDEAADAIVNAQGVEQRLCSLLSSRDTSTRRHVALLVQVLTRPTAGGSTLAGDQAHVVRRRKALSASIEPLVNELRRGAWWLLLFCVQPDNKGLAARALGNLTVGCWANTEDMMRTGVVPSLMRILRMKCMWAGTSSKLLALKGDAAFAVASIAKGGDLPRGRLQEAGALSALEQLWTAQVHNVDGKEAVGMREEARLALKAVRGGGAVTSAPNSPMKESPARMEGRSRRASHSPPEPPGSAGSISPAESPAQVKRSSKKGGESSPSGALSRSSIAGKSHRE